MIFGAARLARFSILAAKTPVSKAKQKSLRDQLSPFVKFARPEFKIVGASLVLLVVSSAVTMSIPVSMGAIIDIVMQKMGREQFNPEAEEVEETITIHRKSSGGFVKDMLQRTGSLPMLFGCLGGIFIIGAAANAGRQILMARASERVIARLRNTLFKKIIGQDITFHDKNRSGELISRLSTDTVVVGRTLTNNVADGLRSVIMSATGVGAMLFVNVDLTVIFFDKMTMMMIIPLVSGIAIFYGKFVRQLSKQTTDASAELTKFAEEKISNIRTVRAFAQEKSEVDNFSIKSQNLFDLGMKEGYASSLFFSSMGFSGNMVILAILYYGGSLVQLGQISIGELTSFFLYTIYVGSSLIGLSNWYSTLNKGAGAGQRLFELLNTNSKIERNSADNLLSLKTADFKGHVEFNDVSFFYPTRPDANIFKGLTFTLRPGETVAIVGHSGSGKSTIAQLLLRFYDPLKGKIALDGISITDLDPHWLRDSIMGLVSQEPVLFATSIKENIRYGCTNASDEQVIEASKFANAHEFIVDFPDGYDTYVGDRGLAISVHNINKGGQKQRIAIARALLKNPKILILDEATSALDSTSEALVQEALERLIKGRTVITIAHRLSTIQKADWIFMIGHGKIIESGSYDELIDKNGPFSMLVGQQIESRD